MDMTEEQIAEMEDKVRKIAAKHGAEVVILRAPEDPEEKKKWTRRMLNLAIQIQFVGTSCAYCGHIYTSVEDFKERNPRRGYGDDLCVCERCWKPYIKTVKGN